MDDLISRQAAIDALENDMVSLDHIIKGMSANDVRLDAYVSQRNQVNYDIYTINNLPPALGTNLAEVGTDLISRAAAQTELQLSARRYMVSHEAHGEGRVVWSDNLISVTDAIDALRKVPSAQPDIIRCKDCKYWNKGSCESPEYVVFCQDYMVGDIETEAEHFCGYAERREATT